MIFFYLFCLLSDENGINHQVSLSTFQLHRPKYCVFSNDPSAHNVCVCTLHENVKFYMNGLTATPAFQSFKNNEDGLRKILVQKIVCESNSNDCQLRKCRACDPVRMVDFVLEKLEADEVTFGRKSQKAL